MNEQIQSVLWKPFYYGNSLFQCFDRTKVVNTFPDVLNYVMHFSYMSWNSGCYCNLVVNNITIRSSVCDKNYEQSIFIFKCDFFQFLLWFNRCSVDSCDILYHKNIRIISQFWQGLSQFHVYILFIQVSSFLFDCLWQMFILI